MAYIAPAPELNAATFTEQEKDELLQIFRACLERQSKMVLCMIHMEETLGHILTHIAMESQPEPSNLFHFRN